MAFKTDIEYAKCMRIVTFLVFPNIMASSISLPQEMLNAADEIWRSQSRNNKSVKIQLAAQTLDPVTTSGGLKILPDTLINDITHTDLLIIPALWRNPINTLGQNLPICEWIKSIITSDTKICAVGTGSSFLAEAKILDYKAATTHWFYFDLMEKKYPEVKWKRQHLITQSGNIFCAGSVNSIADLAIHFIEQGYSAAIARKVESQFSPEIRRAYDSHLFDESPNTRHHDEVVAEIQDFIQRNYSEEINFTELANKAGISSRTLQRRFRSANGYSPLQYQQYIRVKNTKELLQNTNLNIQDIAELIGYVDASHLSQVFKNHTQQTPSAFRKTVRGKLFSSRN
jgi:transcriptional regulator GlxA family with amidase domain